MSNYDPTLWVLGPVGESGFKVATDSLALDPQALRVMSPPLADVCLALTAYARVEVMLCQPQGLGFKQLATSSTPWPLTLALRREPASRESLTPPDREEAHAATWRRQILTGSSFQITQAQSLDTGEKTARCPQSLLTHVCGCLRHPGESRLVNPHNKTVLRHHALASLLHSDKIPGTREQA